MRRWRGLALAGALAIAACSPQAKKDAKEESAADAPRGQAFDASGIEPGLWKSTVTIDMSKAAGVPENLKLEIPAQVMTDSECVTSEDVREFASKNASPGGDDGEPSNCSKDVMTISSGRIEGIKECAVGDGGTLRAVITGRYGRQKVEMNVDMSGDTPLGAMKQTMRIVAERVGACPG